MVDRNARNNSAQRTGSLETIIAGRNLSHDQRSRDGLG